MILQELYSDTQSTQPRIFLDMDGVLCDFFGAWAQRLGGSTGASWEYIKTLSRDQTEASIRDLARDPQQVEDFFANIEPLSGGQQIVKLLGRLHVPFTILSAPLDGYNADASIRGKKQWLAQHGLDSVPKIFTRDKYLYATQPDGTANILVDDYGKNVRAWREHGGTAVKHDDHTTNQTLTTLAQLLK